MSSKRRHDGETVTADLIGCCDGRGESVVLRTRDTVTARVLAGAVWAAVVRSTVELEYSTSQLFILAVFPPLLEATRRIWHSFAVPIVSAHGDTCPGNYRIQRRNRRPTTHL